MTKKQIEEMLKNNDYDEVLSKQYPDALELEQRLPIIIYLILK